MRPVLDPRTAAVLHVAVPAAIGSPAGCLEWSTSRALAADAIEDQMADVLLAIAPVAGPGRVVCAAPDAATALEYDIAAGLENRRITGNSGLAGRRKNKEREWL
jgi:alkylhydroperoxidase/carboxymuconolactone decarboxylase family protein YurZ